MREPPAVRTERLLLRPWRAEDLPAFAALNGDPRVMECMPKVLGRGESDEMAARIQAGMERRGFGLWAVEVVGVAPFVGFVGLTVPGFEAAFTPCVEVGWRLAFEHWGKGYATEGARGAVGFGFEKLGLEEIVSFTAVGNVRSRRVMEKVGMVHRAGEEFDHPMLEEGHWLRRHVLYRLKKCDWGRGRWS